MEDISFEMKEIEGLEKFLKEERFDYFIEKIEEDLDKFKGFEQSLVNEDLEYSKIVSKLDFDVELVKYFMFIDSKDSIDDGIVFSRFDKVDFNELVISVFEDNFSVVESNISEVVLEFICFFGEEE